jgi:hypothetical protein
MVTAFVFSLPQSASTDSAYELKGEAPGMTLKQFKSNHRHADCSRQSTAVAKCHVSDGVSFAGVPAHRAVGMYQGIFADFIDDRMVRLEYSVSLGSAGKIILALKDKYGDPIESTKSSATWKNAVGSLHVFEFWEASNPVNSRTVITSELNNNAGSKDI